MSRAYGGVFDLAGKQQEVAALEEQAAAPDFWDDPQTAQSTMQRLSRLQDELSRWQTIDEQIATLSELLELAIAEDDLAMIEQIASEMKPLREQVDGLEFELLLNGEYDNRNAFLSVQAGAGGVDAQDWAEMLLRMYMRWAQSKDLKVSLVERMEGEEAGIRSATLELRGPYAYGYAKAEAGIHRLVRLSPFDAAQRRHTSFARVEVMPEVESSAEVEIKPEDLRIDVFRAQGHGGQGVNTTDSAVRITHLPTGIVVTCQNERSQLQNRETAMKVLRARLLERELERQAEERARLKGEHREAAWGNQIRSYVLHPYTLVKDHRTGEETGNTTAVLDGEIDRFIEAYLRWQLSQKDTV
ncbi:MAG: peptide chain release factor 2 [Herpetosiphonaceae bacterium]|nr:MAG: peptide chain release factor 2 [Herpetosiphonaceae bacterium]